MPITEMHGDVGGVVELADILDQREGQQVASADRQPQAGGEQSRRIGQIGMDCAVEQRGRIPGLQHPVEPAIVAPGFPGRHDRPEVIGRRYGQIVDAAKRGIGEVEVERAVTGRRAAQVRRDLTVPVPGSSVVADAAGGGLEGSGDGARPAAPRRAAFQFQFQRGVAGSEGRGLAVAKELLVSSLEEHHKIVLREILAVGVAQIQRMMKGLDGRVGEAAVA